MAAFVSVSPEFKADPRKWMERMIDRLMQPGVKIQERDKALLVKKRRHYQTRIDLTPGPCLYEQICRIAKACGVMPRPPAKEKRPETPARRTSALAVPPRFAVGAPMPPPPPLRRPVALSEAPETWDPAGMCR